MEYKESKDNFKDPVCGMVVSRLTATASCEHEGRIYYFCADVCRDKFESNPKKYIRKWPRKQH